MILSRVRPLSRATSFAVNHLLRGNTGSNFKQSIRTKTWVQYRNPVPPDEYLHKGNKPYIFFTAVFWWWMLWHLVCEYEELVGPDIPKLSDFTDEELGIPPLEADDP